MTLPCRTALTLALTMPACRAGRRRLVASSRTAGTGDRAGQSAAARPEPLVAAPAPVMALGVGAGHDGPIAAGRRSPIAAVAASIGRDRRAARRAAGGDADRSAAGQPAAAASGSADAAPLPSALDKAGAAASRSRHRPRRRDALRDIAPLWRAGALADRGDRAAPPYAVGAGRRLALPQVAHPCGPAGRAAPSRMAPPMAWSRRRRAADALPPPYAVFVGETSICRPRLQTADAGATAAAPPAAPDAHAAGAGGKAAAAAPDRAVRWSPARTPGRGAAAAAHRRRRRHDRRASSGRSGATWSATTAPARAARTMTASTSPPPAGPPCSPPMTAPSPMPATNCAAIGNLILIKHADGWMTAYAHNSDAAGQARRQGAARPADRARRRHRRRQPSRSSISRSATAPRRSTRRLSPGGTTSVNG